MMKPWLMKWGRSDVDANGNVEGLVNDATSDSPSSEDAMDVLERRAEEAEPDPEPLSLRILYYHPTQLRVIPYTVNKVLNSRTLSRRGIKR